ncbi:Hypothetical protein PHPALM_4066 [Phytophthora palmivora]|uniref:Uncharacterized protein n=1 Tax=Phytophthora palmivora TaxID=4796 RepID=A0A2P4YKU2_9STRA|nr:Hypothetical protein PHPALM_4066 [Phytophthora palmivora]
MSNGRESQEMEAKDAVPDLVPSAIGTSRASDESTASGPQTSYGSSSASSMRSLGQQVGALALVAQGASGFTAAGDLGFQVTRTVIPHSHVAVDQEDVEMESSMRSDLEIAPKKTGLPRISAATTEPKLRVSSLRSEFDGCGSAQDTETQGVTQSVMEAVRLERERLDARYAERWQQRETEADAERARWASEVHAGWKEQVSTMEQKVQELEAEREREQESSQNIQRFHAGQVHWLKFKGGTRPGNAIVAGQRQRKADLRNTPEVAASQRKATFVQSSADTSGRGKHVKRGHGAPETKVMQDVKSEPVPVGKSSDPKGITASRASRDSKTDSNRSVSKKHRQEKKKRRDVNPPLDSDPSSDSSDDDSSSESSDDSSYESPGVNLTAASATQAGTTLLTFRPYINSNTLAQGGWSTKMRTQELKIKLPGAARDWFNQLPKHTQRDWKELASAFRNKYCKARPSYPERYFTMEMKNSESALDFFYRLKFAAGKTDIDFRKSSKRLEKHIRRFITKLRDTRLKTSLQGRRFRNIADLAYALEQDEEVWSRSDRDAPPSRVRDFRADNIPQGRFKPKRAGLAYVTRGEVSDSESDEDPEIRARFQEVVDEPSVAARISSANSGSTREISGEEATTSSAGNLPSTKGVERTQTLPNEVYRVMDNMGWRPPNVYPGSNANSGFRSPRRENPNWDKFCEKCRKWGHPEEDCWKDRKCDRCLKAGHPTHMCRAQPCENCGKMHLGKPCEDWKTLEAVKKLSRQGALKDMPSQILDKLLDGEANSGRPSIDTPKKPKFRRVRFAEDASTQTDEVSPESFRGSRDMTVDTNDLGVEIDSEFQGWRGEESDSLDSVADNDDSLDAVEEYWDIPIYGMPGTPLEKLKQEYERCMRLSTEDLDYEPAVYMREGSELLSQLRDQLVMLSEIKDLTPECKIEEADVGVPGKTTPEMEDQVRRILEYHRKIFLGDSNAAHPPARGVVCDLDVGDAKPVAQRPRSIAPHLWTKVYELLKKLLENGLIETSTSPWASPIVIVLKKNGVDIRMCTDYRVVNSFINLAMASGFWAIKMTERAKLISAFVCPYGHYQWDRMPFGLKNAPLIFQAVLNNCLWGFWRLPPEEEAEVDQDVLHFLGLNSREPRISGDNVPRLSVLTDEMTVFQRNIPAPTQMGPVLGRSSYIDDIAHGAPTWKQLCQDLNALLFRLRYWNISERLPKSEFGMLSIPYLSHEISAEGIRAIPKIAKGVKDLTFPTTLKGVQSFMGSLNYYNKFIEDLPVIAAVLYELTEEHMKSRRDLSRAQEAFEILKHRIVSIPLLRHPDRSKPFVIIPHANPCAASAVLGYHIAEKEVIAILSVLEVFRTLVEGSPKIVVYTRYSVLKWLLTSQSADGRTVKWGLKLSHWDLEIRRVQRDEDCLAAILGAGITPREHLDEVAENLIPAKGRVKPPVPISIEMLEADYEDYILSFDGAAKTSTRQGSCGCILWRLPGWEILDAQGFILRNVTINDAEYHGLLKGLTLAFERGVQDIVVVGDSRIAIQQAQGLINCNQPNLQRKLAEYEVLKTKFKFNQKDDPQGVEALSVPGPECAPLPAAAKVFAVITHAQTQESEIQGEPIGPLEYQAERWRRIKVHQDKDDYLLQPKDFLRGNTAKLSHAQASKLAKDADDFVLDSREVLYRLSRSTRDRPRDMVDELRLVVPQALQPDILHYAHEDFQGGHQGITRTYEKLRSEFYWNGMYADVEGFVKECVDCASDKGYPQNPGPSPGNIEPRRPFEVVSMNFVTHLPKSDRGNTFLLLFQDSFSGFVMCKPISSTTAQDVAEVFEEQVFRRFGASSMLRHTKTRGS